jgi:catechol 2,3-dioxygenase-like lactoylglutathione lyase family enzyme
MLDRFDIVPMLPAQDLERAKRFYAEKLGLTPVSEDPGAAHYRSGSASFDLYPSRGAGTAQHTLAAWMVDDIHAALEELRGRGVVFEEYDLPGLKTEGGIADLGFELAAWFKDSEGNILSIGQLRGP